MATKGGYLYPSVPVGRFASQLEERWDNFFRSLNLDFDYIGDQKRFADFEIRTEVAEVLVEVKPDSSHVQYALDRLAYQGNGKLRFIVIGWPVGKWWLIANRDGITSALQIEATGLAHDVAWNSGSALTGFFRWAGIEASKQGYLW